MFYNICWPDRVLKEGRVDQESPLSLSGCVSQNKNVQVRMSGQVAKPFGSSIFGCLTMSLWETRRLRSNNNTNLMLKYFGFNERHFVTTFFSSYQELSSCPIFVILSYIKGYKVTTKGLSAN
ncbi:hypothetical protein BLOT_002043 [Blomia tropicalis]|nr:hypothetical protein BLOT_002043 [Blomia tropicalis]